MSKEPGFGVPINANLGCIPCFTTFLSINEKTHRAISEFEASSGLPGILLMDDQALVGLLSRQRFYEVISHPFNLEFFSQRSLQVLWQTMPREPLILDAQLPITVATRQALQRRQESLYEPVVVQFSAHQQGVIDIHTLLLTQNSIHELTLRELQENKKALSKEKDLAQITLKSIVEGVITTNKTGQIQEMNPIAEKLTGWSRHKAAGLPIQSIFKLVDEATSHPLENPVITALEQQTPVCSSTPTLLCQLAQCWDIQYSASPLFDKDKELLGAILVFRDVTQQQTLLKKIHWQASHDSLTGLINRAEFETRLSATIHEIFAAPKARSHTLIFIDLDRFKAVNDTCGHSSGNELLRQVSELLRKCLREQDLLARLGGDEFGILLLDCNLLTGKQIADRIYQTIQDFRFFWQNYVFTIGVSIGVTSITGEYSAQEVLQQADSACYLAKHQGRNQIRIFDELQCSQTAYTPTQLVNHVTEALAHSKFRLFHQRIMSVSSSAPAAVLCSEILLRLTSAAGEEIVPNAFIHTAERYNLMTEIDAWVIQKFCDRYEEICHFAGSNRFSINLSGASLNQDRLSHFIHSRFESRRISPQNVCFEITETVAIANLLRARTLLQSLKESGFRLALDDFGTGMSSFHYLRTLPVDYLKIDGSLIRDIVHDQVAREMVSAIIKIGHEMKVKTVAEWVETPAIHEILQSLKVDYIQGFLFHGPEILPLAVL